MICCQGVKLVYTSGMKRIISLFTIMLLLAGLFSCVTSPAPAQSGSSVWKISNGDKVLFLGGSVHVLRDKDFPLPKEFDLAFSQSLLLVLEADIEQMADEKVTQYLLSRLYLPGAQTLQSTLDSNIYDLLKAECTKYGLPIDAVSRFKPFIVITMLTVLQFQKFGFVQQGVDAYYLNEAQGARKPIYFLETVEAQIDMLASMGEGYENNYVLYSLNDMSNTENMLTTLLVEWITGNASLVETSLFQMKKVWPDIYQTLITDRNTAWMPQIKKYLASEQVPFIVVGTAHLHGPDGLLVQLKNSGYIVEQLK